MQRAEINKLIKETEEFIPDSKSEDDETKIFEDPLIRTQAEIESTINQDDQDDNANSQLSSGPIPTFHLTKYKSSPEYAAKRAQMETMRVESFKNITQNVFNKGAAKLGAKPGKKKYGAPRCVQVIPGK